MAHRSTTRRIFRGRRREMERLYRVTFYTVPDNTDPIDFKFSKGRVLVKAEDIRAAVDIAAAKIQKVVAGEVIVTKAELLPN